MKNLPASSLPNQSILVVLLWLSSVTVQACSMGFGINFRYLPDGINSFPAQESEINIEQFLMKRMERIAGNITTKE